MQEAQEILVWYLDWEDPLEEEPAWAEETGGL